MIDTWIKLTTGLLCLLPLVVGCARVQDSQNIGLNAPVDIHRTVDGYLVAQGADSVLLYRDAAAYSGRPYARAHYIHPLFGPNGDVLTEDFPEDHLHHHGIFWAWHQILQGERRLGDGWIQEGITWDVSDVDVVDTDSSAVLRAHVHWHSISEDSAQSQAFVEETATISVYPAAVHESVQYRAIDFTIALRALIDGVRIGGSEDEKGYGGFSVRLRLPEDVRFTGRDGVVEPQETALDAGPWLAVTGTLTGSSSRESSSFSNSDDSASESDQGESYSNSHTVYSAVAILQHPSNPDFPHPWILRRKDSMQNVRWPGKEPVLLSDREPVTLRYRLIVHDRPFDVASLNKLYDRFSTR